MRSIKDYNWHPSNYKTGFHLTNFSALETPCTTLKIESTKSLPKRLQAVSESD